MRNSACGKRLTEILEYQEGDLGSEQDVEEDRDDGYEEEGDDEEEEEDDQSAEGFEDEAGVYQHSRSYANKSRSQKIAKLDPISSGGSIDVN